MDAFEFFKNPPVVWFLIGLIFALLELGLPGLIIIFFGIGAWITSLTSLVFDLSVGSQILIFVISSVLALIFLRKWFQRKFFQSKGNVSSDDDDELTGKRAKAQTAFNPGEVGKVELNGALWEATSDEPVSLGQMVEIINKKSIKLIVKPINN